MRAFDLLVAAFALVQLARYARGAVLFLFPSLRVSLEEGAAVASPGRARAGAELAQLGFVRLGVVRQRGPLGALPSEADAWARAGDAYADVQESLPEPRVTFLTPFPGGATVLTTRGQRRSFLGARTQAGAMPGATLAAALAAHRVAVERFRASHGSPLVDPSAAARVEVGRRWYAADGRREVRRAAAVPFAIAALSALILASAVNILLHSAR